MKKEKIGIIERVLDYFYIKRRDKAARFSASPFSCVRKNYSPYLAFNLNKNEKLAKFYKRNPKLKCLFYRDTRQNIYDGSVLLVCKTKEKYSPIQEGSVLYIPVKYFIGDEDEVISLEEKNELINEIESTIKFFNTFMDKSFVEMYGNFAIPIVDWFDTDYEDRHEYRQIKRKKLKI